MAKSTGNRKSDTPTQTPSEAARALAAKYVALLAQKALIEEQLEEIKSQLIDHAKNNDDYELDAVNVIKVAAKPKLDFGTMTKKAQDQLIARLKSDLPEFVLRKEELDVEALYLAQGTNAHVQNALKANGVTIPAPGESFQIRKQK